MRPVSSLHAAQRRFESQDPGKAFYQRLICPTGLKLIDFIWHTQGSGKTALAFYNVHYLTDYFQAKGTIPKFYFIVDRLDLLIQAAGEFRSRGLTVHEVNSREAFARDIKSTRAVHNDSGHLEITVVNIQKFEEDPDVIRPADYSLDLQRIYFLDEVHRSYNPKGSFLANLNESDPQAIKIGLTDIQAKARELNRKNALLAAKYANDAKYARLHKRLLEKYPLSDRERKLFEALNDFKAQADEAISQNSQLLKNEEFAERELLRLAITQFNKTHDFGFDTTSLKDINKTILKEYLDEASGRVPA